MIGVSKRCCPACTMLLEILFPNRMHIAGSHNTVYACTLPPWLPLDVMTSMVTRFGDILRAVLRNVMQDDQDNRRQSGDSAGLAPSPTTSSEDVSDAPEGFDIMYDDLTV
jgi:hypothetical protein